MINMNNCLEKRQLGYQTNINDNLCNNEVMSHHIFVERIRKTLYFGQNFDEELSSNDDQFCDNDRKEQQRDGNHVADIEQVYGNLHMSKPLAEYAAELFSAAHRGYSLKRLSYVELGNVQTVTPTTLIMALIYLDRLNVHNPSYLRKITPQELFIVSMMVSTKFYVGYDEDVYLSDWTNNDQSMTESYLKSLEIEFLKVINWNIFISNEEFFAKLIIVEKILAYREGLKRGWLTYAELIKLLPSFTLARFLLNHFAIVAISYAASVITISGAILVATQIPTNAIENNPRKILTPHILNGTMVPVTVTTTSIPSATSTILPDVVTDYFVSPSLVLILILDIDQKRPIDQIRISKYLCEKRRIKRVDNKINIILLLLKIPKFLPQIMNKNDINEIPNRNLVRKHFDLNIFALKKCLKYQLQNVYSLNRETIRFCGLSDASLLSTSPWSKNYNQSSADEYILLRYKIYLYRTCFITGCNSYCLCTGNYKDVYLSDEMTAFLWHLYSVFLCTITKPFLTVNFI